MITSYAQSTIWIGFLGSSDLDSLCCPHLSIFGMRRIARKQQWPPWGNRLEGQTCISFQRSHQWSSPQGSWGHIVPKSGGSFLYAHVAPRPALPWSSCPFLCRVWRQECCNSNNSWTESQVPISEQRLLVHLLWVILQNTGGFSFDAYFMFPATMIPNDQPLSTLEAHQAECKKQFWNHQKSIEVSATMILSWKNVSPPRVLKQSWIETTSQWSSRFGRAPMHLLCICIMCVYIYIICAFSGSKGDRYSIYLQLLRIGSVAFFPPNNWPPKCYAFTSPQTKNWT